MPRRPLPDPVLRAEARLRARARVRTEARGGVEAQEDRLRALVERMSSGPIAGAADPAEELAPELAGLMLGPRRKHSAGLWADGVKDLAGAEEAMLALTCARAGVQDGMEVLDLGSGWGALSLWLAEQYPAARVLAVCGSDDQRAFVEAEARRRGLEHLEVVTQGLDDFGPDRRFDRVLAVGTLERVGNWAELLRRIRTWLAPDGRLFVHVRSQRRFPYACPTGELVPSHDLLGFFQRDLVLEHRWALPGTHHARTLEAWLRNLDADEGEALRILGRRNPPSAARRLLAARRSRLIAEDETWAWRDGDEWLVSHYVLAPCG